MEFIADSANQYQIDRLEKLQEKELRLSEYKSCDNRENMSKLKIDFGIENLSTLETDVYPK